MSIRILVNGQAQGSVSALDRGLAYGDGLFETMWASGGRIALWSRHMLRLAEGCRRLRIPLPDGDALARECASVSEGLRDAVVRLTVTRGIAPRGYAVPADSVPTRIVQAGPAPKPRRGWYHHGVRVHVCETRLAAQPLLAGLKHLNRLEQVLARNEWHDDTLAEGLVCDMDGFVISATAANLFAVIDGELSTPALDQCGVAGVARTEILARHDDIAVRPIRLRELEHADEIFLSSSVRGIVPVAEVPTWERHYAVGPRCRKLQDDWVARGLMAEPVA